MNEPHPSPDIVRRAEVVRTACLHAMLDAFEDASIRGLCCTGAWECAVGAVRALDLKQVLQKEDVASHATDQASPEQA